MDNLTTVKIEKPSDKIIEQIRALIHSGQLKSGTKLPSERKLSEKFGLGRGHVREAIQKLEFYGVLKTLPQSGTIVAGLGVHALVGLINNILELHQDDFHSLIEARIVLEVESAGMAAKKATKHDIRAIENTLGAFKKKVETGKPGVEEDHMFHLAVAEAAKNTILKSLLLLLISNIIRYTQAYNIYRDQRFAQAYQEHKTIFHQIQNKNSVRAGEEMRQHLIQVFDYIPHKGENGKSNF
ncbi:GntR family transcriptional repressor for pyruvate dehydrogenase complex [Catalinimonas alkaloidigena]|uniref:FadR/GntR family transcriptional regulator n=1 Tax=Catalinimonas alkaloidigena TaxID=1075417 RepID=UPI0024059BFC|nr:FadR/GntR family transcriptional regulator [Catalinimonas alkaloidigena]MDF9799283.1 GntR family transcriptional repressor for pyruvate dehydrogenase complex [Catalinimonas alkaloidigena]